MSTFCVNCGAVASYGQELGHKSDCPSLFNAGKMSARGESSWDVKARADAKQAALIAECTAPVHSSLSSLELQHRTNRLLAAILEKLP